MRAYCERLSCLLEQSVAVGACSVLLLEPARVQLFAVHTAMRGRVGDASANRMVRAAGSLIAAAVVGQASEVVVAPGRWQRAEGGVAAARSVTLNGHSALAVPLECGGQVVGVLQLLGRVDSYDLGAGVCTGKPLPFDAEEVAAVRAVAAHAACLLEVACARAGIEHPGELMLRASGRAAIAQEPILPWELVAQQDDGGGINGDDASRSSRDILTEAAWQALDSSLAPPRAPPPSRTDC